MRNNLDGPLGSLGWPWYSIGSTITTASMNAVSAAWTVRLKLANSGSAGSASSYRYTFQTPYLARIPAGLGMSSHWVIRLSPSCWPKSSKSFAFKVASGSP